MNNNSKILLIVAGIILTILILGLGIYFYNDKTNNLKNNQRTPSPKSSMRENEMIVTPTTIQDSKNSNTLTTVDIFLVSLGDEGNMGPEIGCGDSLVAINREVLSGTEEIKNTINELISLNPEQFSNSELYNAFGRSNLEVENVSVENGTATVIINGDFQVGGVCDSPRIEEQLTKTITQFSNVSNAEILINGERLEGLL